MSRPRRPGSVARGIARAAGPVVERLRRSDAPTAAALRRLAARVQPDVDAAVREAQAATDRRDWQEAVRLWDSLVSRWSMIAPPRAWARLAIAHRELGDHTAAEEILSEAMTRFPDDLGLAMESAQLAMVQEKWELARTRWLDVLERFPTEAPAKAHARLAISHRELGDVEAGATVLDRANIRFPDDPDLAAEWAQFAMVTEDWNEAVRRWRDVLARFPDDASARALTRLSQCHRELGEFDRAEAIVAEARERFPDDAVVVQEWTQLALASEDWPEALRRWEVLRDRFAADLPAKAFAQISVVHRRLGNHEDAATVVEQGLRRHPNDTRLVGEAAQLSMAAEDWPTAVARWQQVLRRKEIEATGPLTTMRFPRTGSAVDWYELAWEAIAQQWEDIAPQLAEPPEAMLYRAIGRTLADAGLLRDADRMLSHGVTAHPSHPGLAQDFATVRLLLSHGPGRAATAQTLRDVAERVAGAPIVFSHLQDLANAADPGGDGRAARHAVVDRVLQSHAPPPTLDGLDRMLVLRVPRDTSLELHVRAGRFLSSDVLRARVREVSEREEWEEMRSTENLVMTRTRQVAEAFGRRFEDLPFLPAEALADAMLFPLYHELVLHVPMARVAADIAAERDASPVYIEVATLTFRYLDGYTFSTFDALYLYFELRRLGVNAVLCQFQARLNGDDEPSVADVPGLRRVRVIPSARAMLPRGEVRRPDHHAHEAAIIPAGLRSVPRVATAVGPALMYSSGSIVKEFAYDRSIRQDFPIEPKASIHPDFSLMGSFTFELWPVEEIPTDILDGSGHATGELTVTTPVGGDWLGWLDRAMHPWLRELSLHSFAEVAGRGVRTAHVCDHLFTESVLFGNAVKAQGGRVVLWPHSANPVHVDQRRAESFDEVHAVTLTGAATWRERFPHHQVHHSPRLMLDEPDPDVVHDPDRPLSVVVLGGRSVLRHMPTMDQSAHEAAYQRFFSGLEKLQKEYSIDVWFKPRGLTGEHEMWLHQTVGGTAGWRRVLEHPRRLQLPNPLFVSISMGTSALLEGLGRGIPGLVVRDFPVRDYTTIDPKAFPTVDTNHALEIVAECAVGDGWKRLLDRETAYYVAELVRAQ